MRQEFIDILGVKISSVDIDSACSKICRWIEERTRAYVCVIPVSTVVACQSDGGYRAIINKADMNTPDGMPLVWVAQLRGNKGIRRTYGPDLMAAMCAVGERKGYNHYFYGGSPETLRLLELKLKARFSALKVTGACAPPFRELSTEEDDQIVQGINQSNPDILWVGLGSPKQDCWMHEHRGRLHVPVMIAVGAAFDFLAGTKPQAPRWMQSAGLEWLFRLGCEPKRLWRRYLIGNTKFLYYLAKDIFRKTPR